MRSRAPLALVFVLAAAPAAAVEIARDDPGSGPVRARLADDDADLALLYGGEQDGEGGPCGCSTVPRGGIPRIVGYRDRVARSTPTLLLNPGGAFDNRPGPAAAARNAAMAAALEAFDAVNLGHRDVAAGLVPPGAVSASVRGLDAVPPWRTVERGDRTVAITGVTSVKLEESWPEGVSLQPPVEALTAALASAPAADLVVVLGYDLGSAAAEVAALDGVDVLVEVGGYAARWDPVVEHGTIWVRGFDRSQQLGELRLWWGAEGLERAVDRMVSMDPRIPADRRTRRRLD